MIFQVRAHDFLSAEVTFSVLLRAKQLLSAIVFVLKQNLKVPVQMAWGELKVYESTRRPSIVSNFK